MCYTPHFYKDENRNSEPVKSQSLREEFRYLYPSCIYRSASTWEFTVQFDVQYVHFHNLFLSLGNHSTKHMQSR